MFGNNIYQNPKWLPTNNLSPPIFQTRRKECPSYNFPKCLLTNKLKRRNVFLDLNDFLSCILCPTVSSVRNKKLYAYEKLNITVIVWQFHCFYIPKSFCLYHKWIAQILIILFGHDKHLRKNQHLLITPYFLFFLYRSILLANRLKWKPQFWCSFCVFEDNVHTPVILISWNIYLQMI